MAAMTVEEALAVVEHSETLLDLHGEPARAAEIRQALATLCAELADMREELDATIEQRDLLSQEVLGLEKDAKRYRWVVANPGTSDDHIGEMLWDVTRDGRHHPTKSEWDAAIDAAMEVQP